MKLKRIKKLTILIITVVLVIGLFLSNTLIKSHANFENTKSFNIIQGKIPNKNEGDIQFAVLVDGSATEEIPKKDSGYHFTSAECTNGANLTFNSVNWTVNVNNLTKTKTLCILKFETGELTFNYGDGSLNTVEDGYNDKIMFYDKTTNSETGEKYVSNEYFGNFTGRMGCSYYISGASEGNEGEYTNISAGENVIRLHGVRGDGLIRLLFRGAGAGFGTISNIQIYLNNTYYTLKDAVENKKIKSIVVINGNEYGSRKLNSLSLYDNGSLTINNFADIYIYFMLEDNVAFNKVKFNSLSAFNTTYDGFEARYCDNIIMTYK